MGWCINESPKRHILGRKEVWRLDRQNRSNGATCERDGGETKNETKKESVQMQTGYRSDHPRSRIETKPCTAIVGGSS